MYLHDYCEKRDCNDWAYGEGEGWDDGNLGNFWTKIRDKIIKPVGRVVAAAYTGGSSEIAFKAYDMQEAQKKAAEYQKAQLAQIEQMGNTYPPYPSPYGVPQPPPYPGAPTQGVYAPPGMPYNQGAYPNQQQPYQPDEFRMRNFETLPSWAIPAGIGAVVLLVLAAQRR